MKRFLPVIAALLAGTVALVAANLPNLPSTPQFAEANQIVGTLNALINQLNGGTGYSGTGQIVSLGTSCYPAAAATPITCIGQRGQVQFTGVTIAANALSSALVITDTNLIGTSSTCTASFFASAWVTAGAQPYISSIVPTANTLTILLGNANPTTAQASATVPIAFVCM